MNPWKDSLTKTGQILHIAFSLVPSLAFLLPVGALLVASVPFVNYVFSLLILDGLVAKFLPAKLFFYAGCAIGANVVLLLAEGLCSKAKEVQIQRLRLQFEKKISLKLMDLEYETLQSNRVQELKRSMEQLKLRIGGIETMMETLDRIAQNVFGLLLAFVSFLRLFQMRSQHVTPSFWSSPYPLILLLSLSFALLMLLSRFQLSANQRTVELNEQINRTNSSGFMFMQLMGDYHFGKDIRIYGLKEFLCSTFDQLWNSPIGLRLMKALGRNQAAIPCLAAAINSLIAFFSYLLAAFKAICGEISVGAVMLYAGSIQVFIQSMSAMIYSLGELLGSGEQMGPYLELFHIPAEAGTGSQPSVTAGESFAAADNAVSDARTERKTERESVTIRFEDVSFRYPNAKEWALRHVSLTLRFGECMAVVGMNGSGKTTMVKLLCRLYRPTEGRITIHGQDIQNIAVEEYRRLFGVVFQDFQLLSLPLGQNIAVSQLYEEWRVYDALKRAGIDDWAKQLPQALQTPLFCDFEENGVEISGGEAQKVAIARAVYRHAIFLILDEPTAALDPYSEYIIYKSVNQMTEDNGVIYISHRLSSCRFCSRIFVFHKGRLIQTGTHEELLRQTEGKYCEMWKAQAQYYAEGTEGEDADARNASAHLSFEESCVSS